jgi:hypothetical protein
VRADPLERITRCPLGAADHQGNLCSLHRRLDKAIELVESLYRQTTVAQLLVERGTSRGPLCEPLGEREAGALDAERGAGS